jgi:DNA-directed RNA polymerase specialized sigma24 family protein
VSTALDQSEERVQQALLHARVGLSPAEIASHLDTRAEEIPGLLRTGLRQVREALERTLRREAL